MSPKLPIPCDDIIEELQGQLKTSTPTAVFEAVAIQIHTAREARGRIEKEGSVVRDMKGSVIPHPAIKIEADAIKIYTGLIAKYQNAIKR
jgi:hypothetical protein